MKLPIDLYQVFHDAVMKCEADPAIKTLAGLAAVQDFVLEQAYQPDLIPEPDGWNIVDACVVDGVWSVHLHRGMTYVGTGEGKTLPAAIRDALAQEA